MAPYLRPRIPAATVFFTVCIAEPGSRLLVEEIDILRDAVRVTRERRPFVIDAWVVLPDHMHAVWTLPEGDTNYSDRWGAIKARFSRFVRLKAADRLRARRSPSKVAKQDAGIWQRRFWEHHIRSEADYKAHMHFCWMNPVKHGLAARPVDWAYSSIHRDIRAGRVDPHFAVSIVQRDFGEVA